ncbi:DUF3967 domain-containing protein [Bacillus sp. SRB3LM]|uniref:DUF3967 domain-containing protein n=1 Tax=Bacillus sp. SRB3LM TaxID=2608689 RepID=UPI0035A9046A
MQESLEKKDKVLIKTVRKIQETKYLTTATQEKKIRITVDFLTYKLDRKLAGNISFI